ncbi:MAG TPA: diguanylate cyclase [Bryobacteraceae bacterium]|nr:diguanylate cyclase [Bryobacteraceae bacterium]
MAIISLRKLMAHDEDRIAALLRIPTLILDSLILHAIEYSPAEYDAYRAAMRKLQTDLTQAGQASDVLVTVGEIIRTIETYNRGLDRFMTSRRRELHSIVSMLTRKLLEVAESSTASASNLRDIEKRIEKAGQIDDIRVLKSKLEDSLSGIRQEAHWQETQSAAMRDQARGAIEGIAPLLETDTVTGLPNWSMAEAAFRKAMESHAPAYAVILAIERLAGINHRFGFAHGDRLMLLYAQHIARQLPAGDQLFRWRGPSLVALVERQSAEGIPVEIRRLAARFEHTMEVHGRQVMVAVSASWMSLALRDHPSFKEVRDLLDGFVTSHTGSLESH